MPIDFTIDKARRIILTTGEGVLTYAEIRDLQDKGWSDPQFDPQFDHLIDLTAVTDLRVSGDELRSLLSRDPYGSTPSRTAIVASDPGTFGVGRMAQGYRTGMPAEVGVFRDVLEALSWLGKSLPE